MDKCLENEVLNEKEAEISLNEPCEVEMSQNGEKAEKIAENSLIKIEDDKKSLIAFILSVVGLVLMCFSIIPVTGLFMFFIASPIIIIGENMLNKYKGKTEKINKLCKIGKILTLVGAGVSVVFLILSVILSIL